MDNANAIDYHRLGAEAYSNKQFRAAAEYFGMFLRGCPSDWNTQFFLAMALSQTDSTSAAKEKFRSISELCPDVTLRQRATLALRALRAMSA